MFLASKAMPRALKATARSGSESFPESIAWLQSFICRSGLVSFLQSSRYWFVWARTGLAKTTSPAARSKPENIAARCIKDSIIAQTIGEPRGSVKRSGRWPRLGGKPGSLGRLRRLRDGPADGPGVAVGIGHDGFAPAVGHILRGQENGGAGGAGAGLDSVGVETGHAELGAQATRLARGAARGRSEEPPCVLPIVVRGQENGGAGGAGAGLDSVGVETGHAELGAQATRLAACEAREPWMPVVGVVRVEHEFDPVEAQGGKIRVGIVHGGAEHLAIEGERSLQIRDDEIGSECGKQAAVVVRRHPGFAGALHGHGRGSRECLSRREDSGKSQNGASGGRGAALRQRSLSSPGWSEARHPTVAWRRAPSAS